MASELLDGGPTVVDTLNGRVVLTGDGFYALCNHCTWVGPNRHARFKAVQDAEAHDDGSWPEGAARKGVEPWA